MEMRRAMAKLHKRGELTCSRCKTKGLFVLWEGGLGRCCYKPKPICGERTRKAAGARSEPFEQNETTLRLRARVDALMVEHGLSRNAFAHKFGVVQSGFDAWYLERLGPLGQERMFGRITNGIGQWLEAEEKWHEDIEAMA